MAVSVTNRHLVLVVAPPHGAVVLRNVWTICNSSKIAVHVTKAGSDSSWINHYYWHVGCLATAQSTVLLHGKRSGVFPRLGLSWRLRDESRKHVRLRLSPERPYYLLQQPHLKLTWHISPCAAVCRSFRRCSLGRERAFAGDLAGGCPQMTDDEPWVIPSDLASLPTCLHELQRHNSTSAAVEHIYTCCQLIINQRTHR
uniref:MTM0665 n=1 Tax=Volvox carteri f. nagariensis TaxID=3068 RepID=D9CJ75_VOLCA|nr:MTM0665 [Volvox carteri f. nagariensis]